MIDLIVDLQYGSTGKGLLAGYLAATKNPTAVVSANMPNAGHTYIDARGNVMIHKVLPNGIVSPKLKAVFLGPGSVFKVARLNWEIEQAIKFGYMKNVTVYIHPNAMPLLDEYAETERGNMSSIASTMQGAGAAQIAKILRNPDKKILIRDQAFMALHKKVEITTYTEWMDLLDEHTNMLLEGSQGFSLGINQRFHPYCTSRECTPGRLMSDMGLPHMGVQVWGTLRTFPIRVGNTTDGTSGSVYADQEELSWSGLGQKEELTTVTQRVRRVFTFSYAQLEESLWHCVPNHLFLNFANYLNKDDLRDMMKKINAIADTYGCSIKLLGHGPNHHDVKGPI